ncbi:unnamed protein product [Arctia plantaginis]|uniref:Uncharacterized protein n=1 Tax=Arctia plantaginis TaxID=874455 RepID=A0A8S1B091_ARCPL|nr:unnamed protein product [Arctia plantaginis]
MFNVLKTVLSILAGLSLVACYCPRNKIQAYGECKFQITCFGTIREVRLPEKCIESTNGPVDVNVNLNDAVERFDNNIDTNFLSTITSLKISAKWKEASLAILQYTSRLKSLILVDIGLEHLSNSPFFYLSRLEDLNLSYNNLTDIQELFHFEIHPNKLNRLWLAHNALQYIPALTFEALSSLTELDLSYNHISDLTEEPFFNLTKLEILRLNNNRIKDLNGAVNSLQTLKHLYLRGNQIQNIDDESLKTIEHLETFDISENNLEKIKPVVFLRHWNHFGNYSRCKIILSENQISHVPNATSIEISSRYVANLDERAIDIHTEIDLSKNTIESVEYNAFQSLIRVEYLDLSENKIKDFVVNSKELVYIKYLNLSSNHISHLYFESFSKMDNLQNLDLSNNRLDFIPAMTFYRNSNLKVVNMTKNALEKLDSIQIVMFHPQGGVLDLSNNTISELKVPFGEGIRLTTLILRSNNISNPSLIDLRLQTDLKVLDMSINKIEKLNISSLLLPISLENLDLSFNKINEIGPSSFHRLERLKFLRLGHNQLTHFQYGGFHALGSLYYLDLSYNRIISLDSKLLTELKSLQILSVRSNDMYYLGYKAWYGHKVTLLVYIDNNKLTCQWLAKALQDYNNKFSKMRPVVLVPTRALNSVDGIPCIVPNENIIADTDNEMADERLLIITQKILEAIREENNNLRLIINHNAIRENEISTKKQHLLHRVSSV